MNFGFFGIQFSFGLQQSNMSAIYKYLGANEADIPMLWLAGPVTGLIVQPIIGALSDGTWSPKFGRRKPFFLIGAVLATITTLSVSSLVNKKLFDTNHNLPGELHSLKNSTYYNLIKNVLRNNYKNR